MDKVSLAPLGGLDDVFEQDRLAREAAEHYVAAMQ
jgi:hypothetical protein